VFILLHLKINFSVSSD